MPNSITSLLGTANQLSVNNSDPANPIVSISNPVTLANTITVTNSNSNTLSGATINFPSFSNNLTNLSVPYTGPSFLYASNDGAGNSNFSWQTFDGSPVTQSVTFSFGNALSYSTNFTYSKSGNIVVIQVELDPLNTTVGGTGGLATGITCDNNSPVFSTSTALTAPIPSYLTSGSYVCIGQLPMAYLLGATFPNIQNYYLGNVYLHNNAGNLNFVFTLGSVVGGAPATFSSGRNYAFGYIQTNVTSYYSGGYHAAGVATCELAAFSYSLA